MKYIPLTPDITVAAFGGLCINIHSFDSGVAGLDIESQSALGVKLGIKVAYPINPQLQLNVRVGYLKSFTSDIETTGKFSSTKEYSHAETPILIGVTYKL